MDLKYLNKVASDVPDWLIEYGNKLDWKIPRIAAEARTQVKKYMQSLPQKGYPWQQGTVKPYTAQIIPDDVLGLISSVNWNAVPALVQSGMKAMLPAL